MNEEPKMITQPKDLKISLYKHQLVSVYNMEKLEKDKKIEDIEKVTETVIGINANQTGYGKTLELVTLILRDKMEWDIEEPYVVENVKTKASGLVKTIFMTEKEKMDTTLIITSQSIIHQWVNEFSFTHLYVTTVTTRKEADNVVAEDYDVVIVSPTMYNRLTARYSDSAWKRFIFDEPGHIRVPAMRKVHAGFYWLVTATPNAIQAQHHRCRNSFMHDMLQSINYWEDIEYHFSDIIIKNDEKFIRESFQMPKTNHLYHKCYNPIYQTIKGLASEKISEMVSSGDIHGAIEALGGKETKNITELVKRKKMEEMEEIKAKIRIYQIRDDEKKIVEWKSKAERVQRQIEELDERFAEILGKQCNICFEPIEKPVMDPSCQNIFCGKCLLQWLKNKNTCPLCRYVIDKSELVYISLDEKEQSFKKKKNRLPTKTNKIVDLIQENPDGSFLIFSSSDSSFKPIRNILNENKICFSEISGRATQRENSIEKYRNGEIRVMFLNSSFNAAGITLTETTDLIIYHEMSEYYLTQIIGRANRLGREKELNVHHLVI